MSRAGWLPRIIAVLAACLGCAASGADTTRSVTIQARVPEGSSAVFLSGDVPALGPWDPAKFQMQGDGANRGATLDLPVGSTLEFKFTLGSWDSVETTAAGGFVPNRSYTVPADGEARYTGTVEAWGADSRAAQKSTASPNVSILSKSFDIPQLGRTRRIWLYLPPDYTNSTKTYPVLYLQDGQNIFDDATSFAGEWGVDETLDQFHARGLPVCIVVTIEHGGSDRLEEYQPRFDRPNDGDGGAYVDFLVHTLKPYVDQHYRTRPDRLNTGIGGSSMGGLISLYAVLKHSDVFGRALLFSVSFQMKPELFDFARKVKAPPNTRLYFLCGRLETADPNAVARPQQRMADLLTANGFEARSRVSDDGKHAEWFWRREFPAAFQWLFQ